MIENIFIYIYTHTHETPEGEKSIIQNFLATYQILTIQDMRKRHCPFCYCHPVDSWACHLSIRILSKLVAGYATTQIKIYPNINFKELENKMRIW